MSLYIERFSEDYLEIKKKNPWTLSNFHATAAILQQLKKTPYEQSIIKAIKKEFTRVSGWSNLFASATDELTYLLMALNLENPIEKVVDICNIKKILKQNKLPQSTQLTFCSYAIHEKKIDDINLIGSRISKMNGILKKTHPIATTGNEIPILLLLAEINDWEIHLIDQFEILYNELIKSGFKKGSSLQSTALLLTCFPYNVTQTVGKCRFINDVFKENKIKLSTEDYILFPILIFSTIDTSVEINNICEMLLEFKTIKSIKWLNRDIKLLIAACLKSIEYFHKNSSQINLDQHAFNYRMIETILYYQYTKAYQQVTNATMLGAYS